MTIAEPMTLLTDYVLAGVTGLFAWRLFRARSHEASRASWALAFAALASAAALGGSYHGFAPMLPAGIHDLLWKATVQAAGIASFAMLVGSAIAMTTALARRSLVVFAAAKLLFYSGWMLVNDAFIYVVADSGIAMAMVGTLHGWSAARRRDTASGFIVGAVLVSLLAAAVQAGGFAIHRHFNHNDLYHVIQIGAAALFYAGARRLHDHSSDYLTRRGRSRV
jgi:hypothetical protein